MKLAPSPSAESSPIWTPDGQRIVFASKRDGANNLYSQAADGTGTVERLTTGPDPQLPAWVAPDGSGILGARSRPRPPVMSCGFRSRARSASLQRVRATSSASAVERLVQSTAIDYQPAVSPNGRTWRINRMNQGGTRSTCGRFRA